MTERKTAFGLCLPSVHLNGTSKDELERQLGEALEAVRDALRKLDDAAPNGRDYYVQSKDAHTMAVNQFVQRRAKLASVATELESIWEGVNEQ